MLLMLAKVVGIGVETADMLVHEVLSRDLRDSRAVGRYAGITGAPDESGKSGGNRDWPRRAMAGSGAAWSSWHGAGSCSRRAAS